jgi:hypothetical protein
MILPLPALLLQDRDIISLIEHLATFAFKRIPVNRERGIAM